MKHRRTLTPRRWLAASTLLGLLAAVPSAASAQNLVTNGGFESGLAGWTSTPPGGAAAILTGVAVEGTRAAVFGSTEPSAPDNLQQTLATTVGESYMLSFYAAAPNGPAGNVLRALWGGMPVFVNPIGQLGPPVFVQYQVVVNATAASTLLRFEGHNVPGTTYLDAVSVVAATAVPEPGTVALLATGLLAVGGIAARRRRG